MPKFADFLSQELKYLKTLCACARVLCVSVCVCVCVYVCACVEGVYVVCMCVCVRVCACSSAKAYVHAVDVSSMSFLYT